MTGVIEWHSRNAADFDQKYERSNAFIARRQLWAQLIDKYVASGASVLDAGCGSGVMTAIAAARASKVLAVDASAEMISLAKSKVTALGLHNIKFKIASIEDASTISDDTFDVVLCSSVLEYLKDYRGVLRTFSERLSRSGTIILSLPNSRSIYRKIERILFRLTGRPAYVAYIRHLATPAELASTLADLGLQTIEVRYYGGARAAASLAKFFGRRHLLDSLFVLVCKKVEASQPQRSTPDSARSLSPDDRGSPSE